MQTSLAQCGDVTTVHIAGSVDGGTADDLQRVLARELERGRHNLVADFSGVDYTSSAGLRVLLATLKRARSLGGDLRLAALNPDVRKVLELSGFTSILSVFPTVDDAVTSFGGRG